MKKTLFITINAMLAFGMLQAQIVNLGGTITVQPGATLVVEGNVDNQSGTIANSGTIEIKGNLINAAAGILSGTGGSYIFNGGTANATITTNGDAINNLTIDKSGFDVLLSDSLTVNGALTFGAAGNSNLVLGAHKLILGNGATLGAGSLAGYIEADLAGVVIKNHNTSNPFTLPIGDVDDYSPISFTPSSSTSGFISARVVDAVHPNNVGNTYITRYWPVTNTVAGTFAATYIPAEVIGIGNMSGYRRTGSNWIEGTGVSSNMATVSAVPSTHDIFAQSAGIREFILSAFLQGAYDSVSNVMTTQLPTLGLGTAPTGFPSISPYGTGETITSIPANVTDWIKVEIVDPSNPSTIYAQVSGFVKNDGTVINTTGGSTISISGLTQPTGSIRIKHRNHLMTRTNPITWTTNGTPNEFDFTTSTNDVNVFTITTFPIDIVFPTVNGNQPMKKYVNNKRAMWSGDINQDGIIRYNIFPDDRSPILSAIGGVNPLAFITGYHNQDITLDKKVNYNIFPDDRSQVLRNIGGINPLSKLLTHN